MSRCAIATFALTAWLAAAGCGDSGHRAVQPKPAHDGIENLRAVATTPIGHATVFGMTYGAGSLWLMTLDHTVLLRIDAKTGRVVDRIRIGAPPGFPVSADQVEDSVVFADGFVWVRDSVNHEIVRVSPGTNQVVERIRTGLPWAPAIGFGSVWIPRAEDYQVDRVDQASGRLVKSFPVTGPTSIAIGAGSVWLVAHRANHVLRLNPRTNTLAATLDVADPVGIEQALYASRSLWVSGANNVFRIDPRTNKTVATIHLPRGDHGGDLAAGAGSVWILNDAGVWRIDPTTNRLTGFFTAPTQPACAHTNPRPGFCLAHMTVGGGWLWGVTRGNEKKLIRVEPHS